MPDWGIWILVALALAVIEMATVGFFSLLFALGAMVASGLALFTESWPLQACVFLAASILFMWFLRPALLKLYGKEHTATAVDRMAGQTGIVIEDIDNTHGSGQIKAEGEVWTARSDDGEPIAKGTRVQIVRVQGVKAVVRKL